MKKLMILAGAIMTTAACTQEEYVSRPVVGFVPAKASYISMAAQQIDTMQVNNTTSGMVDISIEVQWNDDTITDKWKNSMQVSVSADNVNYQTIDDSKTLTMSVPAGKTNFYIRHSTAVHKAIDAALNMKLAIVSGNARLNYQHSKMQVNFKASSPLKSAPSLAIIEGRILTDTLWFLLNSRFYASAPAADRYSVELLKDGVLQNAPAIVSDRLAHDSLGVILGRSFYSTWLPANNIMLRLILNNDGVSDTIGSKAAVSKDLLQNKAEYDFKDTESYFALFANSSIAPLSAANAAKTDIVLRIAGSGENYTISSMRSDSCTIAIVQAAENDFNDCYRTHGEQTGGAQHENYSGYGAMSNTLAADAIGNISVSQYSWYAVKIAKGTGSNEKLYYGYLKIRTHMVGSVGDTPAFNRVELRFKYGEKRDYDKE